MIPKYQYTCRTQFHGLNVGGGAHNSEIKSCYEIHETLAEAKRCVARRRGILSNRGDLLDWDIWRCICVGEKHDLWGAFEGWQPVSIAVRHE